jgi:transposase-like protein
MASPDAIEAVVAQAGVQTCIVHPIRASMRYVNYGDRKKVAAALRPIYTAAAADAALEELERFDGQRGGQYPMIARAWREHWDHIVPFLALPGELHRVVDTTNTIEGLHRQIHKAIKTSGHFPDEQAATKLIYLAIEKSEGKGARQPRLDASARSPQDPLGRPIPSPTSHKVIGPSHAECGTDVDAT